MWTKPGAGTAVAVGGGQRRCAQDRLQDTTDWTRRDSRGSVRERQAPRPVPAVPSNDSPDPFTKTGGRGRGRWVRRTLGGCDLRHGQWGALSPRPRQKCGRPGHMAPGSLPSAALNRKRPHAVVQRRHTGEFLTSDLLRRQTPDFPSNFWRYRKLPSYLFSQRISAVTLHAGSRATAEGGACGGTCARGPPDGAAGARRHTRRGESKPGTHPAPCPHPASNTHPCHLFVPPIRYMQGKPIFF